MSACNVDLFPRGTEVVYIRNVGTKKQELLPAIYHGKNRGEGRLSHLHLITVNGRTRWVSWYSIRAKPSVQSDNRLVLEHKDDECPPC